MSRSKHVIRSEAARLRYIRQQLRLCIARGDGDRAYEWVRRLMAHHPGLRRAWLQEWLTRRAAIARRRADSCERKAIARIEAHRRSERQARSDDADAAAGIAAIVGSAHRGRCPSLDYYDSRG